MTSIDRSRLGIIVSCTVANMVGLTPVVHATFGTFLIPLSTAFGWRRASISAVLAILAAAGAVLIPLAGYYADRHGARRMLLAGNLMLAGAVATLALSNGSLVQFYASYTAIAIAGAIPCTAVISKLVSDWFDHARGTALGFTAGVGNALGSTLMPIVAAALLTGFGWREAYLGIAAIAAGLGFPFMYLLLRDAPRYAAADGTEAAEAPGYRLGEALRMPVFWLILVAIAAGAGCLTAIFSHVVPILAERHVSLAMATAVISAFALVCAIWQVGSGLLLDRIPTPRITAPMYLAAVGGLALLELGSGSLALLAGGALLGVGLGTQYGAMPMLIARYFGTRSFGAIIGVMYSASIIMQGVTPVLLDHAFDTQQTYRYALVAIGLCLAAGAALLLLLPAYREKAVRLEMAPMHV